MPQGVQSVFPPRRGLNTRHVVEFRDFSGGEFGTLGQMAPHNSFTGTNMVRFIDGSIGPRAGLFPLAVTGLPVGIVSLLEPTPTINIAVEPTYSHWCVIGTQVFGIPRGGGAAVAYTGAFAQTPIYSLQSAFFSAESYVTLYQDKTYKIDHTARTVTAISGSPGGYTIAWYGLRLIVANIYGAPLNRIQFSAAGDPLTWPARNYLDVDSQDPINALYVLRNRLIIAKRMGWWALSGVPGVNDAVREILPTEQEFIAVPEHGTRSGQGLIWFLPWTTDYPAVFDGVKFNTLRHLTLGIPSVHVDAQPQWRMMALRRQEEVALVGHNVALLHRNGAWTKHTFGSTIRGYCALSPPPASATTARLTLLTDGGTASTAANLYVWPQGELDRPAIADASMYECVGDGGNTTSVAGTLTTPEWWGPAGNDFKVRMLLVDFTKYSTGGTQTNHFDITVDATRRYDSDGSVTSNTYTFDEAPTGGTSGTRVRKEFLLAEQGSGAGFRVNFTNVRGVKIHGFDATLDLSGPRSQ